MVEHIKIVSAKHNNTVVKLNKRAYLLQCAEFIKQDRSLRFKGNLKQKVTFAEAEYMRQIHQQWTADYVSCKTNTPPNLSKLGRYYDLDDTTTYRILNYMRYVEDTDITYDYLVQLGFIKEARPWW